MLSGRLLARNTILNLLGQVVIVGCAFALTPYILSCLGADRFGVLALVWVVLGYSSLADLGFGRAMTKRVAELLGTDETERIPTVVWTSQLSQATFGLAGGIALTLSAPFLSTSLFHVKPELVAEVRISLYVLAAMIPLEMCNAGLRGLLEANQRFDLANAVRIPSSCLNFLLPALGAFLHFKTPGIVSFLLAQRLTTTFVYVVLSRRILPSRCDRLRFEPQEFTGLLRYGGWVSVANAVAPVIVGLDRCIVASLLDLAAVARYTIALNVVPALAVLSTSLQGVLFPASSMLGERRAEQLRDWSGQALKLMLLIEVPVTAAVVAFAGPLLRLWVGPQFGDDTTTLSLQIIAIGFVVNSTAAIPSAALYGLGRPKAVACIQASELALYGLFSVLLTWQLGIVGTAFAWGLRAGFEAFVFSLVARRRVGLRLWAAPNLRLPRTAVASTIVSGLALGAPILLRTSPPATGAWIVALLAFYPWFAWRILLSVDERVRMRRLLLALLGRGRKMPVPQC